MFVKEEIKLKFVSDRIIYLSDLSSCMIKKSYILLLLSLLPFCCMAILCSQTGINFQILRNSIRVIEKANASPQSSMSLNDSTAYNLLSGGHDKIPLSEGNNENSDEPEQKEEKKENNEDNNYTVFPLNHPEFNSNITCRDMGLYSSNKSIVNTPLYILFHSWKSILI